MKVIILFKPLNLCECSAKLVTHCGLGENLLSGAQEESKLARGPASSQQPAAVVPLFINLLRGHSTGSGSGSALSFVAHAHPDIWPNYIGYI